MFLSFDAVSIFGKGVGTQVHLRTDNTRIARHEVSEAERRGLRTGVHTKRIHRRFAQCVRFPYRLRNLIECNYASHH